MGHPGVVQAMVFGALAVSLTAVIGVGLTGYAAIALVAAYPRVSHSVA
jgi:hypothetical protein